MNDLYHEALAQFTELFAEAKQSGDPDATAMSVATADANGRPTVRTVLLKQFDERGFVFFTNFNSRKGRQLKQNPYAALLFMWKQLRNQVQVKIEGAIEPVTTAEADAYFATRPRASQIGAWASLQSEVLPSREVFDQRYAECEAKFADGPVPRPEHWSGFRVVPERIEFWFGAQFRLHDRQVYTHEKGGWQKHLLYP